MNNNACDDTKKNTLSTQLDYDCAGAINANLNTAANQTHTYKFHASRGHGFAAEQANHLHDTLTGQNALIVGGDNAKNGADRLINNCFVQTKYCQTASDTVAAAFEHGRYRYINADGSPMQLEVPADQYDHAVELMRKRIEQGQIQEVKNPADAKDLVRKGSVTYSQAVNIAKFGTIESIAFDAANGAVISTSAMGVSAIFAFAKSLWEGSPTELAIENALCTGLQIGGVAFANAIVTAQFMRTSASNALMAPTKSVVKVLGSKTSATIANALRTGANIHGAAAMNNVTKLLHGNFVTAAAMTVVLSTRDIGYIFQGKISGKQLFKNISTTAGSIAGGTAGVFAGKFLLNLIAPGAGEVAGFVVTMLGAASGGTIVGSTTNKVIGHFIEDDAVALVRIIEGVFCHLTQEYLLSEEEIEIVLDDIKFQLSSEMLLDMFASGNHSGYADQFVRKCIERIVSGRCRIMLPTQSDILLGVEKLITDSEQGGGAFLNQSPKVNPVEIGEQLTGKTLQPQVARKAWYATKQVNLAQRQVENRLEEMVQSEEVFQHQMEDVHFQRNAIKEELSALLGGTKR